MRGGKGDCVCLLALIATTESDELFNPIQMTLKQAKAAEQQQDKPSVFYSVATVTSTQHS